MEQIIILCVAVLFLLSVVIVNYYFRKWRKSNRDKRKIRSLAVNSVELTPEEFFELRNKDAFTDKVVPNACGKNFEGVYILYNKTQKKYYVGQGKNVIGRVNSHFTGKGNGDVYADYKYGDEFVIRIIALKHSGYRNLNALERSAINTYDAYASGYNKTRGNK